MNKNTINWTDNKVANTNSQQRPNQMANEQYYMDTMPVRTLPNMTTYGDNVQSAQSNPQGTQAAQPAKNKQVAPMTNQMSYQETAPMTQGVRNEYLMNAENAQNSQGTQGVQSAKNKQKMQAPMSNQMSYQGTEPMTQGVRNEFFMPPIAFEQGPPPVMDKEYIAGYLSTLIGKNVRAEFAISTGLFLDKAGILREVGVNYFVLEDIITRARIMCDLYSVKFVTTL